MEFVPFKVFGSSETRCVCSEKSCTNGLPPPPDPGSSFAESSILTVITLALLQLTGTLVGIKDPLMDSGIDSLTAPAFAADLGKRVCLGIPATLIFDHPTVGSIANYLTTNGCKEST